MAAGGSKFRYSGGAPTQGMIECLRHMADTPTGQIERRRGNLNAAAQSNGYWNNYWTTPDQPPAACWYVQGHTIAGLAHRGLITLTHTRKGAPSRYVLNAAGRRILKEAECSLIE